MDVSNILPSPSKFPSCTGAFSCCETARQGYNLCLRSVCGGESTTNQPCYEQQRYIVELHFKCQGDVSALFTLVWVEAVPWSPPGRWTLVAAGLGRLLVSLKLDWVLGGKAPCKRPMPPLHPRGGTGVLHSQAGKCKGCVGLSAGVQLEHHFPYVFLFAHLLGMKLMLSSVRPPPP